MASKLMLIDTGPIVALLNSKDSQHAVCAAVIAQTVEPMVTSWLVIAEAAWLLRKSHLGFERLLGLLDSGIIECRELGVDAPRWISHYAERYRDMRPQIADISLVYLAEKLNTRRIFTLDRRDFAILKSNQNEAFDIIP